MNRFRLLVLSGIATATLFGCSSSTPPEKVDTQSQPVATVTEIPVLPPTGPVTPGTDKLGVLTVLDTGTPTANTALLAAKDKDEMATLRGIALGVSTRAGVSSPATIQAVAASDRRTAASILSGSTIQDMAPVYVVRVKGGPFMSPLHPPGATAPTHAFLTVTIDAATKRVTDIAYLDEEPDLTQFGPSVVDLTAP